MNLFVSDLLNIINNCSNYRFLKVWFYFQILYFGQRFSEQAKKENIDLDLKTLTYGSTPIAVWQIIKNHLKDGDRFLDLGCGRGLGLFYLSELKEIHVMGVDVVHKFIETAEFLKKFINKRNLEFFEADLFLFEWPQATAIFIPGTCYSDALLKHLVEQVLKNRPRIIFSLSTALGEYGLRDYIKRSKDVSMPWGKTTLYILECAMRYS